MNNDNRVWLIRNFGRSRHQQRCYSLDVEQIDEAQELEPVSRARHEMAILLHDQARQRTFFWSDERRRKLDFVVQHHGGKIDVFDCVDSKNGYSPRSLDAFRRRYPRGENYLVSPVTACPTHVRILNMDVVICRPEHWASGLASRFRRQIHGFAYRND